MLKFSELGTGGGEGIYVVEEREGDEPPKAYHATTMSNLYANMELHTGGGGASGSAGGGVGGLGGGGNGRGGGDEAGGHGAGHPGESHTGGGGGAPYGPGKASQPGGSGLVIIKFLKKPSTKYLYDSDNSQNGQTLYLSLIHI